MAIPETYIDSFSDQFLASMQFNNFAPLEMAATFARGLALIHREYFNFGGSYPSALYAQDVSKTLIQIIDQLPRKAPN